MPLQEFRKAYYKFSAKASDSARALAFAGIAIVWVFRIANESAPKVPKDLLLPLLLFAVTLAADMLHYAIAAAIWGVFHRLHEKKSARQQDRDAYAVQLKADPRLNWPAIGLFWFKIASVVAAYAFLIRYLYHAWVA